MASPLDCFPSTLDPLSQVVPTLDDRSEEDLSIERLASQLRTEKEAAKRLYQGAKTGWEGYVEIRDKKVRQLFKVENLKVCLDPFSGKIVADFARGPLTCGGWKRVKDITEIAGPVADVSFWVRYTSHTKDPSWKSQKSLSETEKEDKFFLEDMERELAARKALAGIPNITELKVFEYQPFGKDTVKTRYLMKKYKATLQEMRGGIRETLPACYGVITALEAIHARGWIHGDVKTTNVLIENGEGLLSDFGCSCKVGESFLLSEGTIYMAPEINFGGRASTEMDMFSFGALLFSLISPCRSFQQFKNVGLADQNGMSLVLPDTEGWKDRFEKLLGDNSDFRTTCRSLGPDNGALGDLTYCLMQFDPKKRPSATEVKAKLSDFLQRQSRPSNRQ